MCDSAARWNQGNPTRSDPDAPAPVDIVDRKKKLVATALAADLAKPSRWSPGDRNPTKVNQRKP